MLAYNLKHHLSLPPEDFGLLAQTRVVLSTRLVLLVLTVTIISCLMGELVNSNHSKIVYIGLIAASVLVLTLNIAGHHKMAKILGMSLFNFILWNVSSSEPYECGTHLHLLTAGFAALVLFGYEYRAWGITFTSISFTLYILSYFKVFSIFPERTFTQQLMNLFFFANSIIFAIINIYIVKMLLHLNYKVEEKLDSKNKDIIKQNEELLKINSELDRFVYSASHDLRAPLASILGLINIQKMDRPDSDIYLNMITDRIHALDKFIHDIIDYSRNNRLQVVNEQIQLASMMDEICEQIKFNQGYNELQIQVNINEHQKITSDALRLKVVLSNLVSNAIKYSDLNKSNPYVKISARQRADKFMISVEDNGIGIEAEHQSRVFDMFYRATATRSGSGLGLYIVKESLDVINGTISIESKPGEGSIFQVTLPN